MAQSREFVDASHALNDLSHALALLESENASLRGAVDGLCNENAKLRELATYALKHIIEFECEVPDREMLRGKPCEDCADYGSSDCPKCMPRMFDVSGIEVDA